MLRRPIKGEASEIKDRLQRKESEGLLELQPQIEPARRAAPTALFFGVPEVWPCAREGLLGQSRKPYWPIGLSEAIRRHFSLLSELG